MTLKDDLIKSGMWAGQADLVAKSGLSTTDVAAISTVAPPTLTTNDIGSLSTTQLGALNAAILTAYNVGQVIKNS